MYRNKNNGKIAEYLREDGTHIWIRIDGVETPILKADFDDNYDPHTFISEFEV